MHLLNCVIAFHFSSFLPDRLFLCVSLLYGAIRYCGDHAPLSPVTSVPGSSRVPDCLLSPFKFTHYIVDFKNPGFMVGVLSFP